MIIIMGSVGSGKSEQTNRLSARLNLPRISTSNLLRLYLTPERESKMLAGDLVDDAEVIEIIEPVIKRIPANQDFILDGFPRTIPQARWLTDKIKNNEVKLRAIIKLNVSDKTVLDRMLRRGRADDQEQVILHRLRTYHSITTPVVKYLRSTGIVVHEVDGEQAPDNVEAQIKHVLDSTND